MNHELFEAGIAELPNGRRIAVVEFMGHPIAEGPADALDGEDAKREIEAAFCAAFVATLSMVMGSHEFGRYASRQWEYWNPLAPPLAGITERGEG